MKSKQIISFIIAAALPLSLFGCSLDSVSSRSETSSESSSLSSEETSVSNLPFTVTETVTLDDIKEHIGILQSDAETSGNEDKLREDIDILLKDLDIISDALSYVTINYYADFYNEDLESEYDSIYETYYIAYELMNYAFANCYKIEEYSSLFEPYVDMEYLDYFTDRSMSLKRVEGYARVDYSVMDEYLDDYYDVAYDYSKNDTLKNREAAEIYLDILSSYDTETFYESYNRDFSADEVIAMSEIIRAELLPAADKLGDVFFIIPESEDVYDNPVQTGNPFETIQEYAGQISPEIAQSADKINDEKLYYLAEGDECYTGSFTSDLPSVNSALVYIYTCGDYYDFMTAVHEFGHFHSSFYDDTTSYLMMNNIDIAEIQSQGMEMLFMNLYDDIYGEQADAMRILKLYEALDAVISGFIIGEFEYNVLKNIDTMTPDDVIAYFDSLMEECGYDANLYEISHLFEQPGYYISYGVSALAALDIWDVSLTDSDKAVRMYTDISKVKCNSEEVRFKSALEQCGFDNVLNEGYIKELSEKIIAYAESFK